MRCCSVSSKDMAPTLSRPERREALAAFELGLVGQEQTLHDLAAHDVLLHDLLHVGDRDLPVPDLLGIDDDGAAGGALVQAASGVGPHFPLQAAVVELLLEA